MARTTLRAKGQLTLPDDVRKAAKLEEGDLIEAVVSDSGEVILRPLATIDRSQAWFWTPEWQAGEREATEQRGARRELSSRLMRASSTRWDKTTHSRGHPL